MRTVGRVVILDVVSVVAPRHEDIERLANMFVRSRGDPHVVVDLSDVGHVTSAFMAGLVVLYKRMLAAFIVAIKHVLDYSSTGRAVVVCILGWLVQVIIFSMFAMLGLGGMALMAAR